MKAVLSRKLLSPGCTLVTLRSETKWYISTPECDGDGHGSAFEESKETGYIRVLRVKRDSNSRVTSVPGRKEEKENKEGQLACHGSRDGVQSARERGQGITVKKKESVEEISKNCVLGDMGHGTSCTTTC